MGIAMNPAHIIQLLVISIVRKLIVVKEMHTNEILS